jgi:hypothetical protein
MLLDNLTSWENNNELTTNIRKTKTMKFRREKDCRRRQHLL